VVIQEAEQLIQNQTVQVEENRMLSLPKINMEIKEMDTENSFKREKYKPIQSYIRLHESDMLDVLYE
jgi:histone acetyltransferase (RNA polymerase elongator complex component)